MTRAQILSALVLVGCASRGERTDGRSAVALDKAAVYDDKQAAIHQATFDKSSARPRYSCRQGSSRELQGTCWTWFTNPSPDHLRRAEADRAAAADHRAAAAALREAEAKACVSVGEVDRDMSPFEHDEDVLSVQQTADAKGTIVTLRAVDGLTESALRQLVDCHLARNAAMGYAMPEMMFCPLAVKNATASVTTGSSGLEVTVLGGDAVATAEIQKRANALR